MEEKISKKVKFKRFLKRNMTKEWAQHFSYQVISFLLSVAMLVGVAGYALSRSYEERTLVFVDNFMITAHTGAFDTEDNSVETIEKAIENKVDCVEIDVRIRVDGTVVMGHDIITAQYLGTEIEKAFVLLQDQPDIQLNLDIKDTLALAPLHELLIQYNLMSRSHLTGIELWQCKKVDEKCPDVKYFINYVPSRFKIFSSGYQEKIIDMVKKTNASGINCRYTYGSATLAKILHENGYELSLWTADSSFAMKRALVCNADNITTHNVNELKEMIKTWGKK